MHCIQWERENGKKKCFCTAEKKGGKQNKMSYVCVCTGWANFPFFLSHSAIKRRRRQQHQPSEQTLRRRLKCSKTFPTFLHSSRSTYVEIYFHSHSAAAAVARSGNGDGKSVSCRGEGGSLRVLWCGGCTDMFVRKQKLRVYSPRAKSTQ